MRFSLTAQTFFPDGIAYDPADIPSDAIEVTKDQFTAAMSRGLYDTLAVVDNNLVIVPGPSLQVAQQLQIAVLNNAYQTAITSPVVFTNAAGTTATFPQTDSAKKNLASCITTGSAAWTYNFWLDVNNQPITPFTYTDLQNLAAAFEAVEVPDFQKLLSLIAAVNAATTVADVQAVVWTSS